MSLEHLHQFEGFKKRELGFEKVGENKEKQGNPKK